jgi:integrase
MRPSEALRLKISDFNPATGTLRVPAVKTSPERVLPLHPTTVAALVAYLEKRRRLCPIGDHIFVGPIGRRLGRTNCLRIMQWLFRGIRSNGLRLQVRPYDLRHTFATKLIAQWSKEQAPVAHRLLLLSRYLGHSQFTHTWWYVSSQGNAMRAAAKQFERYIRSPIPEDL